MPGWLPSLKDKFSASARPTTFPSELSPNENTIHGMTQEQDRIPLNLPETPDCQAGFGSEPGTRTFWLLHSVTTIHPALLTGAALGLATLLRVVSTPVFGSGYGSTLLYTRAEQRRAYA